MTGPDVLFSVIVVLGFIAAVVDHWLFGEHKFNPTVRMTYLGCCIVVDGWLAVTVNATLWLWVLLYVWGVWNAMRQAARARR